MQGVQVWSLVRELRSHMPRSQKTENIKQKQYCNKFNKEFKNGPHQKKKKLETLIMKVSFICKKLTKGSLNSDALFVVI